MRSLLFAVAFCCVSILSESSARGEDLTQFNAQDWQRYEATQSVIRSMPASLRRQGGYSFRDNASIEADPTFKAWSTLNPLDQAMQKNKVETTLASNRAIRQTAVGGYWAFNNPYLALMQPNYGYGCSPNLLCNPCFGSGQ